MSQQSVPKFVNLILHDTDNNFRRIQLFQKTPCTITTLKECSKHFVEKMLGVAADSPYYNNPRFCWMQNDIQQGCRLEQKN